MAGEVTICVVGNTCSDAELRFTPSGKAVANFTVASTPRTFDRASGEWKDGEALFLRCNAWGQLGENIAECIPRGTRVVVSGRLKQRSFETREGEKRTVVELDVDEVGPSLRYATATVRKAARSGESVGQDGIRRDALTDPWASPPAGGTGGYTDEPPFHHHPSMDEVTA